MWFSHLEKQKKVNIFPSKHEYFYKRLVMMITEVAYSSNMQYTYLTEHNSRDNL